MGDVQVTWAQAEADKFLRDAGLKATRIVADRIVHEANVPVLDLARTRPPGEGWSMPPGNLKRSVRAVDGEDVHGQFTDIEANAVNRFTRKHRHAIRDWMREVLVRQLGRPVP